MPTPLIGHELANLLFKEFELKFDLRHKEIREIKFAVEGGEHVDAYACLALPKFHAQSLSWHG